MNHKEFKELLSKTTDINWFNSIEIVMNFPVTDDLFKFTGLADIQRFLREQIDGWENLGTNLPNELKESLNYFKNTEKKIIDFVNSYSSHQGDTLTNNFRQIGNSLRSNSNVLIYDSPESEFLVNLYQNKPEYFIGAYTYLIGDLNQPIGQKNNFNGYLLAYEFKFKNSSDLVNRRKSEKASLTKLKTDFKNNLGQLDAQLVEHLSNSTEKYEKYGEDLVQFKADKEKTYSDWFINTKGEVENFQTSSNEKIIELERTYKEKLKLSEPAEYWSKRANSLRKQGWVALIVLVILVFGIVWSLGELLWKTPEQIYSSFFNGDKSAAIRWSIIYVTFISFMAFAIRAITKVMFSSFHLARDSEERHTLTYFYLSLLKESNVDKEDRQLIMQSLFSRAETGLLKDDSTPAMPNDMIGKVFGGNK